ncbi:MAG: preprotein translocase subunit SecE [Sciscionella sp.]
MSDDREQERAKGRKDASRPVTAAARRERRASTRADGAAEASSTKSAAQARTARSTAGAGTNERRRDARAEGKSTANPAADDRKGRPTPTRDRQEKRGSLFARLVLFLREVVAELRKVIWPTRKQLITYTTVVLIFVAFMVALVFGLDIGFHELIFMVFG